MADNRLHEVRRDLYNKALQTVYGHAAKTELFDLEDTPAEVTEAEKQIGICGTCGDELMTVGGKLMHHDGRFSVGIHDIHEGEELYDHKPDEVYKASYPSYVATPPAPKAVPLLKGISK